MSEKRVVLNYAGKINPKKVETFLEAGGFKALEKALTFSPEEIIKEVKEAGLRGRGGAGFPTGLKWELTRRAKGKEKFLVCNADEGEMGTFKDRYILENDPFTLMEGILISAHALGVKKAFIYLRGEYFYLRELLKEAISQTKNLHFFERIGLELEIFLGQGAYVCGEEMGLLESVEGKRGEPRFKPPFPPQAGLFSQPTLINNVETLMNIPRIILKGADWFKKMGTEKSKGTKVFSLCGDVEKPGVYELEMGTSLKVLVEILGEAKDPAFIQVGGAAGKIVPREKLNIPLSFETILGAGGVIVYNRKRDMVEVALKTLEFFQEESCGKCTPCREGTQALLEIVRKLKEKETPPPQEESLRDIILTMKETSLCGLGQTAPQVVEDLLELGVLK